MKNNIHIDVEHTNHHQLSNLPLLYLTDVANPSQMTARTEEGQMKCMSWNGHCVPNTHWDFPIKKQKWVINYYLYNVHTRTLKGEIAEPHSNALAKENSTNSVKRVS